MYRMTNSEKWFDDEFINWLIYESGFNQSKCKISVYYKYATDGYRLVVLYNVYDCVYCYTYEELWKWFVDTLVKKIHAKFLGYAHWFMSIRISQLKDHSISVDQDNYATSVVENDLDTATPKENKFFIIGP